MPTIDIDHGFTLHYKDVGSGDPVVLIPGWSHSSEAWDAQIRELAATHRVIAVDPRGQGRSDAPYGDYSIARHAADLNALLDHLDLQCLGLIGWSMGGLIALLAASQRPGRIDKLALIGSNGVGVVANDDFPYGMPADVLEQFGAGEIAGRPAYRRQSIEGAMYAPEPSTVEWLLADSLRTPSWAALGSLHGLATANQVGILADISIPVLMLHGVNDPLFNIAGARWVAEKLSTATLIEYNDCGHFPHVEVSTLVNNDLIAFLAKEHA